MPSQERGKGAPIVWPGLCNLTTLLEVGEGLHNALLKGSMGVSVAMRQRETWAE